MSSINLLSAMNSTLHGWLETAFVIALLAAFLRVSGREGLFPFLKWGSFLSVAVSSILTYGVVSGWDREATELVANVLGLSVGIVLMAWLVKTSAGAAKPTANNAGLLSGLIVLLGATGLLAVPGLGIGLKQARAFGIAGNELATQLGAVILALMIAGLIGVTLYKTTAQTRARWITLAAALVLFVLLVRDATAAVQVMLVKGMLPLSDWLFRLMVPLVNNYAAFFYALFAVTAALAVIAIRERRRQRDVSEGLNPAQKRKLRAVSRRMGMMSGAVGMLLALALVSDMASSVLASRPIALAPATPVVVENGRVAVPVESVADGKLHRFSVTAGETAVRFLVVYKGSGIYGVGLDACEFCGVAGYRQEQENVICNRCNAAIAKTTIGFPGGCNPIPLYYLTEGEFVVIPAEKITAVKAVFAR